MSNQIEIAKDVVVGTIRHGSTSVGTTSVQITTDPIKVTRGVRIKAAAGNANTVYVGTRSNVTANSAADTDGYPLGAGEEILVPVDDVEKIHLIAGAVSQTIFWFAT